MISCVPPQGIASAAVSGVWPNSARDRLRRTLVALADLAPVDDHVVLEALALDLDDAEGVSFARIGDLVAAASRGPSRRRRGVVEMRGLEPLTPAMRTRCSPS